MQQISLRSNEEKQQREVIYKGKVIKSFSYYDDYAYTKARDYAYLMERLPEEDFRDKFPEFFL